MNMHRLFSEDDNFVDENAPKVYNFCIYIYSNATKIDWCNIDLNCLHGASISQRLTMTYLDFYL